MNKRLIRNSVIAFVAVLMIASIAWNARSSGQTSVDGVDLRNPNVVALGQQVYRAQCASCHGANLEGQVNWQTPNDNGTMPAPPHDENGHTWHHSDELLFQITKEGGQAVSPPGYQSGMPAFGGTLTDREIWAVLSYIKSTWPAEIQAAQEQANR